MGNGIMSHSAILMNALNAAYEARYRQAAFNYEQQRLQMLARLDAGVSGALLNPVGVLARRVADACDYCGRLAEPGATSCVKGCGAPLGRRKP